MVDINMPPALVNPLLILLGIVFIGAAAWFFISANTIEKNWQLVNATVQSSSLGSAKDYSTDRPNNQPTILYYASIQYRYVFGGREYTGSSADYAGRSRSKSSAQQLVDAFPAGSAIPVRVDPSNPASSRAVGAGAGGPDFCMLSIFVISGIIALLLGIKGILSRPAGPS